MPQKSLIVLSVLVLCLHHSFASLSIHQLSPHISEAASCTSNNECGFGECQDGECVCYDMEHYWPSEGCSTYHDAPELEEGQWCTPNVNNAWCSYLGTCNAEGTACECDDAPHRLSQDRCAVFYSPPPLEDDQWCNPDLTNAWCSYLGTCNSDGSECICVEQPHRISADRCAEWHDVIPPTSVPTPASEVRSCLRVVAYDQFGDGWEDIAKLYYWGQSYPTGQEFDELSGTLSLNGCESIATVECLPVAEGVNHDYYFSLRGFDDMTEIESLPQYYWDILYSVQVVDTNGTVVSETLGGFNSTIVYRYDVASEDYSLVFAQNTNGEPVLNSCGVNDIFPEDVLLPESATCADITVQTTGTISASAMNTLSGRYRAPAWYITDSVSKNVLYAYGSSWGPLPVTVCETCLDDGQYIFRSTGAYNPASDDVSWSFCGVSSTRQSELRFEIINGECVVDSLLELSGVCGYLYAGQCAANTECNLGTCTDGECVCNDPVHYWASENCAVYHERVTSSPTHAPSVAPSGSPSSGPTVSPTSSPTVHLQSSSPTFVAGDHTSSPSSTPTHAPTMSPTTSPTLEPGTTHKPTSVPSLSPTVQSTNEPTTSPTMSPTTSPTLVPGTTHEPTSVQSTNEPTTSPTMSPMTSPTLMPGTTHEPTSVLSLSPTVQSTNEPTMSPTTSPTLKPGTIHKPTSGPTHELFPTISPSSCPTVAPTISPTVVLSSSPSLEPEITHMPSSAATTTSSIPTIIPTCSPTVLLTYTPSLLPISSDTASPSSFPSVSPTTFPSSPPTVFPTSLPTSRPTLIPGTTHAPTSLFLADERASLCGFLGTTNLGSLVSSGALSGWSCVDEQANPCIGWTGISCNGGRISGVDLSGIGITGTIPDSIGGLSELSYMDVSRNFLVGPLPESLGNLTKLTNLFLQENNFGSVERRLSNENPESRRRLEDIENDAEVIENLVSLSYLNIGGNGYTGPIPSSLCSIPLQTLVVTAISESSYLPNQFSCIASCLAENSQLVLTIPADVPICVVEPPTNAPTIAAGALAGNNVSQNTGNTSIAITVGTCLLFLMFLGCIFCRNRMQHKKHERELELAVSRDVIKHEKGSGELHLHRLGSMSSSDSDEESNGTNEYTVKSGTSRSKRRQGYGKVPSMPIEWSDKDNFKGEKPHNDDDSFPIVIDFSDSGTNDRDDITEAIFGQKSVQSPSGNHKRGIVMRTDTKDIFKLHDSTDDGDDDGNTSCTRSQRDTVDMAAGSGDTYSGMSEIDMQSRSSYFSGSESRNSYTATSYTDTQNSYTTGSYTTGTYTTGSYIGNSLGRSSYTSYTGSASTPFEKLVTTGNTGHISSKEPTQTSNTLGDGLSRSDVATKAPSHTNTQLSRDAETATSFTGDTYSASTYASVGPSQADDTWFTSDTFARQSYDSRDPSYDSRDGYSASSYTYTDPRGSRDNYTASSYTDTRDPRDSVMSQSSLGSYTRTSYTDTRDPRDSMMSQSSMGSYTRTSYTDTRDPRGSYTSQSSADSYTRDSYTATSYSQSIPSTYPHIDTGVGFTSNPMNRHTVIGQMSPFPMERTENNDAPLSSSPDQSATRNPMMRHTYAGTTAAASHIPFSDHSSGAQNPGLPPSGAVRPDGVTAPSNPSADDQFDEQPRIVALPGLPPRVPLTRQQSSDTRDSFSLGDISELTDDFRSQSPRGKSGKLFYL